MFKIINANITQLNNNYNGMIEKNYFIFIDVS